MTLTSVRFSLIVQNRRRWIGIDEALFYSVINEVNDRLDVFADMANETLVPTKTGQLQESFGRQREDGGRRIRFYWTAPYATYVNEGIPPSPGRYVEAIERRLVNPSRRNPSIGMHPGFSGRHFAEKVADSIRADAVELFQDAIMRRVLR